MISRFKPDRQIDSFRKPFSHLLTPYQDTNININVQRFCRENANIPCMKSGKVIFIGDAGVGKTSLIRRFCKNKFEHDSMETLGVDFELEEFRILEVPFNIELWDTAGQERFKWITNSYYRGANVIVLVFDLSNIKTLHSCSDWLDEAQYENIHDFVFLVGNKLDAVSEEEHALVRQRIFPFIEECHAEYWATSSKTGKNVKNFFFRLALLTFESVIFKELSEKGQGDKKEFSQFKIKKGDDGGEFKGNDCAC